MVRHSEGTSEESLIPRTRSLRHR